MCKKGKDMREGILKLKGAIDDNIVIGAIMGLFYGFVQTLGMFVQMSENGYVFKDSKNLKIFLPSFFQKSVYSIILFTFLYIFIRMGKVEQVPRKWGDFEKLATFKS